MKYIYILFIVVFVPSCATYSAMNEKEWVKNHIDTGELNKESLVNGKVVFTGSIKPKYSNITEKEVENISLYFLNMLETKYGKENVKHITNNENIREAYEIGYEVLNNSVTQRSSVSGRTECYISERNVSVNLTVKNIKKKVVVWAGTIDKKMESSNCTERSDIKSESLIGVFVEALVNSAVESTFDSITGTYEAPPSTFKVASRTILGFYKTMP